ncbi:uncharacterized protein Gasu_15260 [Galdieria sulphuraria]|uniref:Telomere length regulation protein conserved domain-containing protein n=1 Tax=Galdieria sulphuraria TaxID=130081 RepID=M2XM62_GALSU|nr:uncharacterized protein Gasu_15260 [Galdieria sulphuraria]EME31287.1 hypothetical protein Gasu_15260 [Galdieria sulphuraria]|eukprot:XP_005707807.1 hypothetical protein Gasu_15260 [Galdieria sulphuraria]
MYLEGLANHKTNESITERGTYNLYLLKRNLKTERDPISDENVIAAVEELSHLFSSFRGKLSTQLGKLYETSLKTIFLSSATQRLDEIFGRPDSFIVLESFIGCGPPLLLLEVFLESLKQRKVSISLFVKCIRRVFSKAGLVHLLDNLCSLKLWTAHDISLLVSLPDRIFNYVKRENISFESDEYYENLFEAILDMQVLHSPKAIDSLATDEDKLISTLITRICAIGQFKHFFHCCFSFYDRKSTACPTQLTYWLASVSPAFMEKMLSDLMAVIESDEGCLSLVEFCLVDISKRNSFARKSLLLFVPRRQLISISGISILSEIFLHICDESERLHILDQFVSLWSSTQLVSSQSIPYQFQITRILLCYLKEVDLDYLHSAKILHAITGGIQFRLGNTEADVRYMGWTVGKQLGRMFNVDSPILTEQIEDFKPSQNLESVTCLQSSRNKTFKVTPDSLESDTSTSADLSSIARKIPSLSVQDEIERKFSKLNVNDAKGNNGSEFLEPYQVSDSDEESEIESDDEETDHCRRKEVAPSTVSELLILFRKFRKQETEESWSLSLFINGLKQLQSMVNSRSRAAEGAISELVMAVFLLDPNAVDPCKEATLLAELRQSTLLQLAEFSPLIFFRSLISNVFQSDNAHLQDKCNALNLLVNASEQLSGNRELFTGDNRTRENSTEQIDHDTENEERFTGTVLKSLHFSLRKLKLQNSRMIKNRFSPISLEAFFSIWTEVSKLTQKKAMFPESREVLLAQSISTLSVFIFCAGKSCPSYGEMLQALTQIAFIHLQHSNCNIRRKGNRTTISHDIFPQSR